MACKAFGGSVGAMGGGEGVVHVDIAIGCQSFDKGRIVLFFALVETGVFQKQDIAIVQFRDGIRRRCADAVGREGNGVIQYFLDGGYDLGKRHVGHRFALRTAEMGKQNDFCALGGQFQNGRRNAFDTGCVRHLAICDRHVEINADENALSGNVVEVVEGLESGHRSILICCEFGTDHTMPD